MEDGLNKFGFLLQFFYAVLGKVNFFICFITLHCQNVSVQKKKKKKKERKKRNEETGSTTLSEST